MDYSKLSDEALKQMTSGKALDYSKLSDDDLNHITQSVPAEKAPEFSPGESAARAATTDLTYGLDKPIAGAMGAVADKLYGAQPGKSLADLYNEYKTGYANDNIRAQKENPLSSMAGSVATLALPNPTNALKVGKLAKVGADVGLSALAGYNNADNDADAVGNAEKSAAFAGGGNIIASLLGRFAGKAGKAVEMGAEGQNLLSQKGQRAAGEAYNDIARSGNTVDLSNEISNFRQKIENEGLSNVDKQRILAKLDKLPSSKVWARGAGDVLEELPAENALKLKKDLSVIYPDLSNDARNLISEVKPGISSKMNSALPGLDEVDKRYAAAKSVSGASINPIKMLKSPMTEVAKVIGGGTSGAGNIAGLAINKTPQLISAATSFKQGSDEAPVERSFYTLPNEDLMTTAQTLQNTGDPNITALGETLQKSIETGDRHKKNAALFTLQQNPAARRVLLGNDQKVEE